MSYRPQAHSLLHDSLTNHSYPLHHSSFFRAFCDLCVRFIFDWVEVGVRTAGVEYFITIHNRYQVLGVAEVDDVVGVAREHDDALDLVATDFIVEDFG